MPTIKVQKVPKKQSRLTLDHLKAKVIYYYPQFSWDDVENFQLPRLRLLLEVIDMEKAAHYYNMTKITAAPYSKDGKSVKELLKLFEDKMKGING